MLDRLEKFQIILLGILLAAGLVYSTKLISSALSKDVIFVTGSSSKIVLSDSARFEFGVQSSKPTKAAAYAEIEKQIPQIKAYLLKKGIADSEIEIKTSSGYNVYKYAPNGASTGEIAYYSLTQNIVIKSKDVNKIKQISTDITSLINKGIDINPYTPEYFYSKLSDIKVEMLGEATADAKNRAAAMLKATHNNVGKIQSVNMGVFQITPVDSTSVSDMGINDTSSIEKKITSVANVTFRIK